MSVAFKNLKNVKLVLASSPNCQLVILFFPLCSFFNIFKSSSVNDEKQVVTFSYQIFIDICIEIAFFAIVPFIISVCWYVCYVVCYKNNIQSTCTVINTFFSYCSCCFPVRIDDVLNYLLQT